MISEQALKEFKKIWKEERGEDISDEFALEEAINTLVLYDKVYHPLPKSWEEDCQEE
ncbi:MAG: hypothetical protein PHN39_04105 [Candidatus Pacebacteria bacterium]|nr:hypothetical protein [Candidatus Paceibacterota bacterium]